MKKSILLMLAGVMCFSLSTMAQDDWTPTKQITGYINTVAEWTDLGPLKNLNKESGIGLSEVGFLVSYKPLENLEVKSTLVYNHHMVSFQDMLVEAYGIYTFNAGLKVAAGKFLTPLSPANVYFYAPINPSGILPMMISHHFLTPQSIAGIQLSGEFGEGPKLGYNVTYGTYSTRGHIKGGIIGLIGAEDENLFEIGAMHENVMQKYNLGGSARVYTSVNDMFSIGLNYFQGTRASLSYGIVDLADPGAGVQTGQVPSVKHNYGLDIHFNYNGLIEVNAEYWEGSNTTTDMESELSFDFTGYYGEVIINKGWFSPFARYEYLSDYGVMAQFLNAPAGYPTTQTGGMSLTSIGGGLAIRPIYEFMLKLDFRRIDPEVDDLLANENGTQLTPFNHMMASIIISF